MENQQKENSKQKLSKKLENINTNKFLSNNWLLILIVFYTLSPLDIIPDITPLLGTVDEGALIIFELIRRFIGHKKEKKEKSGIIDLIENKNTERK